MKLTLCLCVLLSLANSQNNYPANLVNAYDFVMSFGVYTLSFGDQTISKWQNVDVTAYIDSTASVVRLMG